MFVDVTKQFERVYQLSTRNTRGESKKQDHGQRVYLWLLAYNSFDPLWSCSIPLKRYYINRVKPNLPK